MNSAKTSISEVSVFKEHVAYLRSGTWAWFRILYCKSIRVSLYSMTVTF